MRPVSKTIRLVAGAFASSAAIAPGELGALASRVTLPLRSTTQMCVSFIEMSNPAKYSMIALLLYIREPILSAPRRTATSLPHVAKVGAGPTRWCSSGRAGSELFRRETWRLGQRCMASRYRWRISDQLGHPPEVLCDRRQRELVLCTARAT